MNEIEPEIGSEGRNQKEETPNQAKPAKKGKFPIIIIFILIVVLILLLVSNLFVDLVGKSAPNFELKSIDGVEFRLSEHKGKVIILDLMSTTCSPCISEMEHLRRINDRYSPDDVMIVTIDIDSGDSKSELLAFKDKYGGNWTFARDTDDVATKYKVSYIPTIVLIDRNGIIRYYGTGEISESKLVKEIDKLL